MLLLALMLVSGAVFAQTGSITGKVFDNKRETLPGVSVSVDGTTIGTATDGDGGFKLNGVAPGQHVLTAKYLGYTTQSKTVTVVAGQPVTVEFLLVAETQSLNEVVVIGYGTQQRKELTGSIATVSSKDFQKGTITSPEQLINGKMAGVQIVSAGGQPGAGSEIRIRAGASLNSTNAPLIVVDNVPLNSDPISGVANPLSLINPNDIETFTVLKDANATVIYGSRASNGVILITTKKGSSGKPQINFSSQNSMSNAARKVKVLSAAQVRDYVDANGSQAQKDTLGDANTDWQDEIFRQAFATDNNISVSGSTKNMPYRVNIGYLDQNGILLRDNMNRASGSIGLSPKFFDNHLKVDLNVKGTYSKSTFANQDAIGSAIMFDPTQAVRDTASKYGKYYEWTAGNVPNPNAPRNPVALIELKDDKGKAARSFGNLQLDYTFHFLPEMRANLNLGYDISRGQGTTAVPEFAAQSYSTKGSRTRYMNDVSNKVLEFYLAYKKDFKSINSNLDAVAGYGYYDNKRTINNYSSYQYDGTTATSNPVFPFDIQQSRLLSYYGRAIYTYAGKYILSGTIRTDGSSRFSPENRRRWGVFPSGAFTWRISEEPMLKTSNVLSDLKLRLSYGITGQQDGIDKYSYIPRYGQSSNESQYQFGNGFYYMYAPFAYDKELKWESTATSNIGIDYGFLNGRITGAVDLFYKKTKDLLAIVNIPVGSNFSNQLLTNVGNMENKGVEFSINSAAIKSKDFNWDLGFNFTYLQSKVTNLTLVPDANYYQQTGNITGATGNFIQAHTLNRTPYSFFVYKQVYDTNGKPLEGVYEDLNGDGTITSSDKYFYKSPAPKFLMGFTTSVNYQKWTLATVLRASLGNYMYDNVSSNLATRSNILNPGGSVNNAPVDFLNTNFTNNQYNSDYFIKNASFLKMDNLSLSYNAGRIANVLTLNVSANVQNVFVITKYKGLDPEVFSGIDYKLYPRPRIYTLGLNVGF